MVVVDTSVWVEFFRGKNEAVIAPLRNVIRDGKAVLTGVVLAEILQGILSSEQERQVESHFMALPYFEVSKEIWSMTGLLSRKLRRKGWTLPLSDLVVAVLAMEHDADVYTTDPHFKLIPNLRLFTSL